MHLIKPTRKKLKRINAEDEATPKRNPPPQWVAGFDNST